MSKPIKGNDACEVRACFYSGVFILKQVISIVIFCIKSKQLAIFGVDASSHYMLYYRQKEFYVNCTLLVKSLLIMMFCYMYQDHLYIPQCDDSVYQIQILQTVWMQGSVIWISYFNVSQFKSDIQYHMPWLHCTSLNIASSVRFYYL